MQEHAVSCQKLVWPVLNSSHTAPVSACSAEGTQDVCTGIAKLAQEQ